MEEDKRHKLFYELMGAVWLNNLKKVAEILRQDVGLVSYRSLTYRAGKQASFTILDYARILGRTNIIAVLEGFGAIASVTSSNGLLP